MSLLQRIKRQIEQDGPLSVSDYMALCLGDPKAGYYTAATPFGRKGDFITAPEISQMFGELIGLWCVSLWRKIGAPEKYTLVEMGPGRGTLMSDLMRAAKIDADFVQATDIRLLEISNKLRKSQGETLKEHADKVGWIDSLEEVRDHPAIFIGNEFLDALPFRQYVKKDEHWHERMVGLQGGKLTFVADVGIYPEAGLPDACQGQPEGTIFEVAPAREAIVSRISRHIASHGGAALLIDYGHCQSGFGDTFQAVAGHQYADVLKKPGQVDLTSHVDFEALERAVQANGKVDVTIVDQGRFLLEMGLLQRAGMLGSGKNTGVQEELRAAVERLAAPDQMGTLFKVMMLAPHGISGLDFPDQ